MLMLKKIIFEEPKYICATTQRFIFMWFSLSQISALRTSVFLIPTHYLIALSVVKETILVALLRF